MKAAHCCNGDCRQGRDCPNTPRLNLPLIWLLVASFVVVLAYIGPSIDDNSAEHDQALALQDAMKAEDAQLRQAEAIARKCGHNTAWAELPDGWAQCFDKHGRKTMRVAMVQP